MKGLANVGDVLAGKYRVDRILGIGGMGMVVSATHLELDQQVAIKFMLPAALESPEATSRFMREARAAGRLTSEHVCRVSDVGKFDSGVPYIVMEYLEGYDLGTLLKRKGPLPVCDAVDYILQAAEGMAEAHGHGIVHRDLKPDNLFLANRSDGSQVIKVLDFGISKASVTGIATKTGDIMGSPAYMAPEQMQSTKDVDARADVWSLGVILYQLISGRMPFIADTLPALCLAVINDAPPSLSSIRKDLPDGLAQVVMKCLAKKKGERYDSVLALAQGLAPFGSPASVGAVTRIRSMLQRKRPPTPPPLMMLPSEFSDVAPTLVGDEDSMQVPKSTPLPAAMIKATETTLGSSSGESLTAMPTQRLNRGVVGALAGAIALVGLIIIMVLIKRSGDPESTAAAQPSKDSGSTTKVDEPPAPPQPNAGSAEPQLIRDELPPAILDTGAGSAATAPAVETHDKSTAGSSRHRKDRDAKDKSKDKDGDRKAKPGDGSGAGSATATTPPTNGSGDGAGSSTPPPPPDDDDKWNHMHHDGIKKLLEDVKK
ncbi:MAG TPA: serine/threonine-protein kinase [Kofleriaceae bacterium]|nr:serine/threonine-protein kinase [Kofleriaceae bacterium]